jgi:hypothetical protein
VAEAKTFGDINILKQVAIRERFADFLKNGSLYQTHKFEVIPDSFKQIVPDFTIWLSCDHCERETPFERETFLVKSLPEADIGRDRETSSYGKDLGSRVYVIALSCTNCKLEEVAYWIQIDKDRGQARKVGQIPEPSIDVPGELREALGKNDVELYKRAKICTNLSYGIAACIYLRRLLENRITPLLKIIKWIRQEEGADETELRRIEEIIQGKVAKDKIDPAGEVVPESLRVEGDNALYLAYEELSFSLHSSDEKTCVELAQRVFPILDRMLVELAVEQKRRESKQPFDSSVKELRKEKTKREKGA